MGSDVQLGRGRSFPSSVTVGGQQEYRQRSQDGSVRSRRAHVRTRLGPGPSARGLQAGLSQRMRVRDRDLSVQEGPEVAASITALVHEGTAKTRAHVVRRPRKCEHLLLFKAFDLCAHR